MAFFKGTATDYQNFLDILKNLAKDDHVSAIAVQNGGTGYLIGDTITLSGGTKYHEPSVEVRGISSGDYITVAAVNAGGTGYAVGDSLVPTTGTYTVAPELEVLTLSGSAVATILIKNPGICSAQPTNPVATTSDGSGAGCTIDFTFAAGTGIITAVHLADAGVYTTQATNPVAQNTTSGSGVNATFNLTYTDTAWETKIDYVAKEATGVAISAAGTGYTLNDIVSVVGGVTTSATTVKITAVSSGVPTAVAINTAGNYETTPGNPASTSGGSGSGLTLTMTWTNSVEERKYLMLHNTTSDQYLGWLTLKETSPSVAYVLRNTGFTGYASAATPWEQHPGCTAASTDHEDTYTPLSGGASPPTITYWVSIQDLRIAAVFKVASVYPNFYCGGIDPFLTSAEYAYPQVILGCLAKKVPYNYGGEDYAGMNNPGVFLAAATQYAGPGWLRNPDGTFKQIANWEISGGNPSYLVGEDVCMITPSGGTNFNPPAAPNGWYSLGNTTWREMFQHTTVIAVGQRELKRINQEFVLVPNLLVSETDQRLYGQLRGIFTISPDAIITSEDRIYIGNDVYRCFQNCNKSNRNYFFAMKEN
jgi:hypothetical protein